MRFHTTLDRSTVAMMGGEVMDGVSAEERRIAKTVTMLREGRKYRASFNGR